MNIHTTRRKAAAILSGRKLQMLEDAGLMVVERQQLEELLDAARVVVQRWMISKEEACDFVRLYGALEAMKQNGPTGTD